MSHRYWCLLMVSLVSLNAENYFGDSVQDPWACVRPRPRGAPAHHMRHTMQVELALQRYSMSSLPVVMVRPRVLARAAAQQAEGSDGQLLLVRFGRKVLPASDQLGPASDQLAAVLRGMHAMLTCNCSCSYSIDL